MWFLEKNKTINLYHLSFTDVDRAFYLCPYSSKANVQLLWFFDILKFYSGARQVAAFCISFCEIAFFVQYLNCIFLVNTVEFFTLV